MARGAGSQDEIRTVTGIAGGQFMWSGSNRSAQVAKDPLGGVYVAPANDTSGASGCWQRIHNGAIRAEWFGATGGADDTDAVQACDEFLREFTEAKTWLVSDTYTTRGFGDALSKTTYATRADADAALAGLSDYDVITVTADETAGGVTRRYRVRSGAFVGPLSAQSYNGKRIEGVGVGKRNGFKLMANSPAWMLLMDVDVSDASFERLIFNGDNPSPQWGGTQNNPLTETLVRVGGYGASWRDCVVRFSGGNGVEFRGAVGSFEWSGGDCVSQYNMGWGVVIGQMSSFKATRMWVEGNETGDILMKYDIDESTMTSQKFNTSTAYWKQSNVAIESIYSENSSGGSVVVQVEGGHFAPRIGQIANWDSTGDRTTVYLKNNADASGMFRGCKGGYFDLGGVLGAKIVCESESWSNTFVRSGGLPTTIENDAWNVQDAGRDNLFVWAEADATAFVPGGDPGNVAVNLGASNFVNNAGGNARLSVAPGGVIGPVQDYHYNHTSGPSHVVASGMNTSEGEGELNTTLSLNATLPATVAQWYAVIVLAANAGQQVRVGVRDNITGEYFNWGSRTWTSIAGADDFGIYRVLRADRSHLAYALPFENDGTAREIRIQVRMAGGGTADLYHAFVTDRPNPALGGVLAGQWLGTPENAVCNSVRRPPADAMPIGTRVWNVSDSELQISDGAAWQSV